MTHLYPTPELDDFRAARDDWMRGLLSNAEYAAARHRHEDATVHIARCDNGDGRQATAMLNGKRLCSACWLVKRGAL